MPGCRSRFEDRTAAPRRPRSLLRRAVRSGDQCLDARALSRSRSSAGPCLHRAGAQRPGRTAAAVGGAPPERRRRLSSRGRGRGAAAAPGRDRRRRSSRRRARVSRTPEPARQCPGAAAAVATTRTCPVAARRARRALPFAAVDPWRCRHHRRRRGCRRRLHLLERDRLAIGDRVAADVAAAAGADRP